MKKTTVHGKRSRPKPKPTDPAECLDERHPLPASPLENISVGSAGAFAATEEIREDDGSDEDNDDLRGIHGR